MTKLIVCKKFNGKDKYNFFLNPFSNEVIDLFTDFSRIQNNVNIQEIHYLSFNEKDQSYSKVKRELQGALENRIEHCRNERESAFKSLALTGLVLEELKLKNFCNLLLKKYNGNLNLLFEKNIDELRQELLSVNGIGPETADSIILYAAKKPIFVVDAYTKRVFGRIGYKEKTYDELQKLFMEALHNSERLFNEYHALIVELGKNVCKKRPLCDKCPINKHCRYYNN